MQNLSFRDNRLYRNDTAVSQTRYPGQQPPRLPTPEPSRSSMEAHEGGYPPETMRISSSRDAAMRPDGHTIQFNEFRTSSSPEHETRGQITPQSPPYEASEDHKPSLPPLKTVLGENMSSPPRTPRFCSSQLQPVPREPTYTMDTYKPPSLYPNKKQKTEAFERRSPCAPASFVSPPSNTFDSSARTVIPPNMNFSTLNSQHSSSPPRRQSVQRPETFYRARSPPRGVPGVSPQLYNDVRPIGTSRPHSTQQYEAPERLPLSASSEQTMLRRFSASQHEDHPRLPGEQYNRNLTENDRVYSPRNKENFRRRDRVAQFGRVEHDRFAPASEFVHRSLQNVRPPDSFVPAPYEYYYTKARKRSNLPKHSTEIMRAWFDQNIGNPYPSEDQKALFANATGISLTQVSNWFINHRRRCPELRDKRVERRKP